MPTLQEVKFLEEIADFFDMNCAGSLCNQCVCESLCTKIKDKSLGRFLRECKDYMEDHLLHPRRNGRLPQRQHHQIYRQIR